MSTALAQPDSSSWIINRRNDLLFIFGGAAASLLVPLLVWAKPDLLPILFWAWIFLFDGTHSWATISRTYTDPTYWKEHKKLLLGSLVWYVVPVVAVLPYLITGSQASVQAFLLVAQGWSYYHIVRQHYGYASLYDRKVKADSTTHTVNKWTIYLGLWIPYFYFALSHPFNRMMANGLENNHTVIDFGWLDTLFRFWMYGLSLAVLLGFAGYHWSRRSGLKTPQLFVLACLLVYSVIFYVVAPIEPLLPGARTWIESFMLIQIMITLFHNLQYHAIVWHYHQRQPSPPLVGRSFFLYAGIGLVYSLGYIAAAWFTTEYPSWRGGIPEVKLVPLAFCIWWGLALHHYYLDQKIWRVSRAKTLQESLNIKVS